MRHSNWKNDPVFEGGLRFGDVAQIGYVKEKAAIIAEEEEKREQGLSLWVIGVSEEYSYQIEVWAEGEFEAIEKANKELDDSDLDDFIGFSGREYEIVTVDEVPD